MTIKYINISKPKGLQNLPKIENIPSSGNPDQISKPLFYRNVFYTEMFTHGSPAKFACHKKLLLIDINSIE
jgi:hypothetical protein